MKTPKCTFCNKEGHTQTFCWDKKQKPIKVNKDQFGKIKYQGTAKEKKDKEFKNQWIQDHPPGNNGFWICYLQIAPFCPVQLDIYTLTLEHIIPKSRGIQYRFDPKNIGPACYWCNSLKGSRTIEALGITQKQLAQRGIVL